MPTSEPRVQPPALDTYSDMPLFNTKAVVHQTCVPAPTLRAWERRYGILSPRRGDNDYRLYSERDMVTVAWLRERVESGMTISQAIALLRSLEPPRRKGRRSRAQLTPPPPEPAVAVAVPPERFSLDDLAQALLQQFANLDEFAASRTIAQALAIYPVEDVCQRLFLPALVEIGQQWANGQASVTVEHFASALIRAQLESLFRSSATSDDGPLMFVGCAPGESHELGALMLALFLRRSGVRVAYLGQNVELESLLSTIATVRPAGVALSVVLPQNAGALFELGRRLEALPGPHPELFVGGQAFSIEPELANEIPGYVLRSSAPDAARDMKKRLRA